ncbi:MBL fold metallo-hydrolase [Sphingomonas sp.]|uniref:MBL fold metallo-hydrolase n=1 Tax=Sphingomonas sp. TaxID=28214 RepID=UPI001ECD7BCB|nr:MBL fold metallo-hydrolase [Sphingomonas sp.]MBX3592902.1 MBL fold metallo-hydrolase [Sphingomonas sp.]
MHAFKTALLRAGQILLWLIITFCLVASAAPQFLDRIYYRGAVSGHFDGARFFNPDGEDTVRPPTGGNRSGFLLRYLAGDDRPEWPARIGTEQDRPPERVEGGAMRVTWVGHATVLIQTDGLNILTDPIWSDVAGPFDRFGPRRVAAPGIAFERLPKIDLVLVSHNHYDHMDLTTLKRLWARDRPLIVTSLGNDTILRTAGIAARGVEWGRRVPVRDGIEVVATRNHHWGSRWFADRNRALWSSFVIRLPGGNIFFAGDTGAGDYRWADAAAGYGPIRFAMLPIGAFRFQEGQMGIGSHIGPMDAIRVWNRLGRPTTLPIHWGTFRLSWEGYWTPPRMLRALQACAGDTSGRFAPQNIGRAWDIPAVTPPPPPVADARLAACGTDPRVTALR